MEEVNRIHIYLYENNIDDYDYINDDSTKNIILIKNDSDNYKDIDSIFKLKDNALFVTLLKYLHFSGYCNDISFALQKIFNSFLFSYGIDKYIVNPYKFAEYIHNSTEKKIYYDYFIGKKGFYEIKFPSFDDICNTLKLYIKRHINYVFLLTSRKIENIKHTICLNDNMKLRKKYNFKIHNIDMILSNIKYYIIDIISPGDQWTMISNKQMKIYKKNNFKIEVFGSPHNARLKYFGSIFPDDNKFGGLGTCYNILDKLTKKGYIKYKNKLIINDNEIIKLIISPPSSHELLNYVIEKSIDLFEKRQCIIHIGITYGMYYYATNPILPEEKINKYPLGKNITNNIIKLFNITNYIVMENEYAKRMHSFDCNNNKNARKNYIIMV
jgi:hypothetical protein